MKYMMNETIDIRQLSPYAQQEVIDFYHFILQKYTQNQTPKKLNIDHFFSIHNLDFSAFKFNREAANER